jgi:electron transfer flavoprotein alpha subunit
VLVAGKDAKAAADGSRQARRRVAKVLHAEGDEYCQPARRSRWRTGRFAAGELYDALWRLPRPGKNIMPRVAALLDVMQISDIIAVIAADTFERPIYAGNAIQTVKSSDAKKVITVRTAPSMQPEGGRLRSRRVFGRRSGPVVLRRGRIAESDRPELTSAKIIISGGRALGSSEKFQEVILPVADKLGAAVGASAPPSMQATRRTTGRSARPARSSLRISTSPAASPVPSSTLPA